MPLIVNNKNLCRAGRDCHIFLLHYATHSLPEPAFIGLLIDIHDKHGTTDHFEILTIQIGFSLHSFTGRNKRRLETQRGKTMIEHKIFFSLVFLSLGLTMAASGDSKTVVLFPADKAGNINPDTHFSLTFPSAPVLGNSGQIRIFDASDNHLVDLLDLSIPPGPTTTTPSPSATYTLVPYQYIPGRFTNANTKPGTPSGAALPTSDKYQRTIIGGFTDAFHFYPVIIRDKTATIYPHNNLLEYGKTYYVTIDPGVLTLKEDGFAGITRKTSWRFATKKLPPPADSERIVVSADGAGDFNTVQGALDFIPDGNPRRVTVFIKNGLYEEIVYFRNKSNITILGEDRDKTVVFYANNEIFNPHPVNIKTNEVPGTFPSRRAAFAVDHSSRINLVNLTIKTTSYGQAEGLLLNGEEIIVSHVNIVGSGDALQSNGSAYFTDCRIAGDGDTILGRGPAFFNNCELSSQGPYMWIRNTSDNHGNVFVNCKFQTRGNRETVLARAPTNGGKNYPYCEAVLIDCALAGIEPAGWGEIGGDPSNVHYWEYNSINWNDGKPVDISRRHPASRQLTMGKDAAVIANFKNPAFVLGGWTPQMAPLILLQPESTTTSLKQTASFTVKVAAIPEAGYQWFKNGKPIAGATKATLTIENASAADAAVYAVMAKNGSGTATSSKALLRVKKQ
jgi:pectinesterase